MAKPRSLSLLAMVLLAGVLSSCGAPSPSPANQASQAAIAPTASAVIASSGSASASPAATASSVAPSPTASPAASASPSGSTRTVQVPLGGAHVLAVTIVDQSGLLAGAAPLELPPGTQIPPVYGDKHIAAWNPAGTPSTTVWLLWGGVICDVTTQLTIAPGPTTFTVVEGPRPPCDASNDGRGLVLAFSKPVDASQVGATFVPSPPTGS